MPRQGEVAMNARATATAAMLSFLGQPFALAAGPPPFVSTIGYLRAAGEANAITGQCAGEPPYDRVTCSLPDSGLPSRLSRQPAAPGAWVVWGCRASCSGGGRVCRGSGLRCQHRQATVLIATSCATTRLEAPFRRQPLRRRRSFSGLVCSTMWFRAQANRLPRSPHD